MKFFLLFVLTFKIYEAKCQKIQDSLIWLPKLRIENISKYKIDNYNLESNYPIRKILFKSDSSIYLFPYYASDPILVGLDKIKENIWLVKNEYLPKIDLGDSISKSIHISLIGQNLLVTISLDSLDLKQEFISNFQDIKFEDYTESYLGYIVMAGKYKIKKTNKKFVFFSDGTFTKQLAHSKSETYRVLQFTPKSVYSKYNTLIINAPLKENYKENYLFEIHSKEIKVFKVELGLNEWEILDRKFLFKLIRT